MKHIIRNLLLVTMFLALVLRTGQCYAQDLQKVDSLNKELQKFEERKRSLGANAPALMDTTKADILFAIIWTIRNTKPDTILTYALPCMEISQKIGYTKGIANAYTGMGFYYNVKLDYPRTLESHQKALALRRELRDTVGITYSLTQIGVALIDLGNHAAAFVSYSEALKFAELSRDSVSIARCYIQLAQMYELLNKKTEALQNYQSAITILEHNNDNDLVNLRLFSAYSGVAGVYLGMNSKALEAVEYFAKSLHTAKKCHIGNYNIINILGNYGIAYSKVGDNSKALEKYNEALQLFRSEREDSLRIDRASVLSWLTLLIGKSYEQIGNLKVALAYMKLALPHAMRADQPSRADVYEALTGLYYKLRDYKNAYEYHVKAIAIRDSIAKSVNLEAVNKAQMQNEFTKIQDSTKAVQGKKDAIAAQETHRQILIRNGLIGGFIVVLLFSILFYRQRNNIKKEKLNVEHAKKRSDELLLNILPSEVADELKEKGAAEAKHFDNVTVLFTDFKNFTSISEHLSPQELVDELHACFKGFDEICSKHTIEKIKTIGDAYLAACGLPQADEHHAEHVVIAALEIREFMNKRRENLGAKTFEIRIGINSGSVVAGIVGVKKFAYDIWGDTVNTAARMEQNSEPGKINISETTHALVKDKFRCEFRGEIDAKNKGKLAMYFVEV